MKSRIWDNLNNCELAFEYPDLPEDIKKSIEKTIERNIPQCLDPAKAKGHCLRISNELMLTLAEAGKKPFVDCKIIHARNPQPHFWILVDGWHIDLTARQFNTGERCPKIWKHEEVNVKDIYFVEKGKGLVLFQLVPFHSTEKVLPKLGNVFARFKFLLKLSIKKMKGVVINSLNQKIPVDKSK